MRRALLSLSGSVVALLPTGAYSQRPVVPPVPVIFDTDMYSDIDDMLALAELNVLQNRREASILAVTTSTAGGWIAPYIDLVDRYYGHGRVPVGVGHGGITTDVFNENRFAAKPRPYMPRGIHYTQYVAQLKERSGRLLYPRRIMKSDDAENAVHLMRRVLAAQPDHSVVFVEVGYMGNLAQLLESSPDAVSKLDGKALVKAKARLLSIMAGCYDPAANNRVNEFNIWMDIPAAQKVFTDWPTAIVASGVEVGGPIKVGEREFRNAFRYSEHHPIADAFYYVAPAYRAAAGHPDEPHEHPVVDLTAVLYAVRPDAGYFSLSPPGTISVEFDGSNRFKPTQGGRDRYVIVNDSQRARIGEALTALVTEPPRISSE